MRGSTRIGLAVAIAVMVIAAAAVGIAISYINSGGSALKVSIAVSTSPLSTTPSLISTLSTNETPSPFSSTQRTTTETPSIVTQTSSSETPLSFAIPTSTVETTNTSLGLALRLFAAPSNGSRGQLVIHAQVLNARNATTQVTDQQKWPYPAEALNPDDPCGSPGPVGFGMFQGYYDQSNYSVANALILYNASVTYSCTTFAGQLGYYSFDPLSSTAQVYYSSGHATGVTETLALSTTQGGYWTQNFGGSYQTFLPGEYTVIAADEWGQVVLLHLTVVTATRT